MTTPLSPRVPDTRSRRFTAGVLLAMTAVLGLTASAGAATGVEAPPGASSAAPAARTVDVMTRNLYLGADLTPVVSALGSGDQAALVGAATRTWAAVQASRPEERLAAIAEEIAEQRPAVVGLQEVTTWTTYAFDPVQRRASEPQVAYDFLELLLDELAERGVAYTEVEGATAHNFASPPIPVMAGAAYPTRAVQLADRDVIIKRADVKADNARTGQFASIIRFPFGDSLLDVDRGWGSVDVRTRLATFRFVNSHLEAFGVPGVDEEVLRTLQVAELLDAQGSVARTAGDLPVVYVGDYNSDAPGGAAYQALVAGVGSDAWVTANRAQDGDTCCFDAGVRDPADPLTSRIDLVVVGDGVEALDAEVVGEEPSDRTGSGLWPSDHAGVVAELVVAPRS